MDTLQPNNNKIIKILILIGKNLASLMLIYLFGGLFFIKDVTQLLVGFFILIFITVPTIYIFFLKNKLPQLVKFWKFYRIIYIILVSLLVLSYLFIIFRNIDNYNTQRTIDFINSKKITLDDVMGENLPPQPDEKLNNATIAGIDVNNNYIRDDVELSIFEKYPNSAKIRAALLQYAQALQLELTQVYNSETLIAVMHKKDSAYFCLGDALIKNIPIDQASYILDKSDEYIHNIVINLDIRRDKDNKIYKKYMTGYSSPSGNYCDVDPTTLLN